MKAKTNASSHSQTGGSSKKIEQSLQESQSILANTEEIARIGTWKWDLRTQQVTWSDGMFRLFGLEPGNSDGNLEQIIADRIHPEDVAAVKASNNRVLEESVPASLSYRILLPDGTERTVWAQGKLLYDEEGRPCFLTGYVQDITEHVQAENKILQLKRLYATLSQVNQVIVRVRDRQELFQTICDVAVKYGEISPAWIGLVEGETGEVRPVAANGLDIEQWAHPTMNIKQGPYQNALISEAVKSARVVSTEDIQADARISNVHSQVRPYPFHSLAVVPFRLRDRTIGILVMVSERKGLFKDQEEIRLLEEMAVDISFALDNMENENERNQTEQALLESENRYRDLVETSNDAIFINCQGIISFINHRGLEMFGATAYDQVLGRSPNDFFHPDFHTLGHKRIKQVMVDQVPVPSVEQKINTLDGRTIPVEVTTSRVIVNNIPAIQVILRDITERKQAEDKLRQSEEKLRTVLEHTPDIVLTVDQELRIQFINRTLPELSIEQAQGSICLDYAQQEHRALLKEKIQQAFRTGYPDAFEVQGQGPNNTTAWYAIRLAAIKTDNAVAQVLMITTDITERKEAEERLRQSEERYRLISENTADVIWVLDPVAGRFKYVSPSIEKLRGYTASEVMSRPVSEAVTPESLQLIRKLIAEQLPVFTARGSGSASFTTEVSHPHKDGSIVHTENTVTCMFNQRGDVEIVGVSRDITKRRRAEQALRENEERLRLSLQASKQGLYDLNVQTGHTVVNRQYAEMLGYEYETFVETNAYWIERLHPDDREITAKAYADYVNGRRPDYRVEFRQKTRDGGWKWILSLGKVIDYDDEGKPLRMLGTHTDITERKRAEEELRASEERYRNLVENMNDIVMEVDANGNYCYLSPNFSSISEYPLEQELGESALKHIHPDDLPLVLQKLEQAFSMERQSATYRVMRNNGEWRWLETVGKPYQVSDGSIHLITVARDITERKQAELSLKQNEHVLRLFVEHSPASIAMFDRDMRYIVASRRYLVDYRLPDEDLTGRSHYEVFPEITERWKEIHRRCLAGAVEKNEEDPFPREDGSLDWVRWEMHPWFEEAGRIGGVILFSEVITDRKQIQDDMRLLNLSLEQRVTERTMELSYANRAKDEFLANMSHELRTPLNAILGLSESLLEQRRGPLNERQIQSIELIASSGRHLLGLINDILDVSKIEAGKLQLHTDVISVKDLCRSSLSFIKEPALKKQIGVEFRCEEPVTTLRADPQRLKQILINLLTNAVKFTPERGRVTLTVSTSANRDSILFSVADTGIGIATDDLKKLFIPFTQLDSSLARQYAGTGLGLSLVRKLAEAHGGSVRVESETGKGSCFTVILPLDQDVEDGNTEAGGAQSSKMDQEPVPGNSGKNILVLLAEDNQVNSEMVSLYLESYGYTVLAAQNGEEVLQRVQEVTPDIIVMDIQMPKMDGLETTVRLRKQPRFSVTPIIAMTALVMPGDRESCFAAGVNEYLSKPVSLKTLVGVIEKLTGPKK